MTDNKEKRLNVWEVAELLFGEMRSSTDKELELEKAMIEKNSKPFGKNLFEED